MAQSSRRPSPPHAGPYRLLALIGRGGHADVHAAVSPTGLVCAVKIAHTNHLRHRAAQEREYELQSWLDHPGLLAAYDAGLLDDGRPWMVMELFRGELSRAWVRDGWYQAGRAQFVAAQAAATLEYLAARGLVHGDLKPSNLMVSAEADVKLLDLGLARWVESDWVSNGHFAGTPQYASPEQLAGQALTPAADVFSLAATTYALAMGRSPFPADRHADRTRPRPLGDVDTKVADLLLHALSDNPADRPTIHELRAALDTYTRSDVLHPESPALGDSQPADSAAHEQLVAALSIAGAPLEVDHLSRGLLADPASIAVLLQDLSSAGLVQRMGVGWQTQEAPPVHAPWNQAIAERLEQALDPGASLARAHVLHHLGRAEEAESTALQLGRIGPRLGAAPLSTAAAELRRAELLAQDATLVPEAQHPVWDALRPSSVSALGQGFLAVRQGAGEAALQHAADAEAAPSSTSVITLLRARALQLVGRHSTAKILLEQQLPQSTEAVSTTLLATELATLHTRFGRHRLAALQLDRARAHLPDGPSPELLAHVVRVAAEIDAALDRPLDADALAGARELAPQGGDARVLAALETLARRGSPAPARDHAIAVTTAPGDDLPELVIALSLAARITRQPPELPDPVAEWLALPGREAWQLHLLSAVLMFQSTEPLREQALHAARSALNRWTPEDRQAFRMQPRWDFLRRNLS